MSKPIRRPLATRPRAPLPPRSHRNERAHRRLLLRAEGALNRALALGRFGPWLRGPLESELSSVELHVPRAEAGLDGLRVVFLSDLHLGSFVGERDLIRLCERVARWQPDLVCLGGDLIHAHPREIELLGKAIALLEPRLGRFAVPGNHDLFADPGLRHWRPYLEAQGVRVLVNEGVRLEHGGAPLWLAGVDDLGRGRPDLEAAVAGAREHEPVLLLSHHPDLFHEAAPVGVDLTLSGHTHGGQVRVAGRALTRHTRLGLWGGHYESQGAQLYVGRGAGTSGIPLRVGAPAEVPLITLRASVRRGPGAPMPRW